MNGVALERDTADGPLVEQLFVEAPGLGLTVHELVLNDDRLCMRLSEHASLPTPQGRRLAAWSGIGLYQWDGERLVENYVEQDFLSRRAQLPRGDPHQLEPTSLDPWIAPLPASADPAPPRVARQIFQADRQPT